MDIPNNKHPDESWKNLTERQKTIFIRHHLLQKEFDSIKEETAFPKPIVNKSIQEMNVWWHSLSPRQKPFSVE